MSKADYMKRGDAANLLWHDKFKAGVTAQATTVGLASADTTMVTTHNTELHTTVTDAVTATAGAQKAVATKDAARKRIDVATRALVRRIKAHPNYTPAIGAQLGIEGPDVVVDLSEAKPVLTATPQMSGLVVIDFVKGQSDGVNLYSRRGAETAFTFLARDTASPYIDNRLPLVAGQPEQRHYKAMYVLDDDEVGLPGDELAVTTLP